MKKLSIYITVLLAAALTACNEDFNEGVASPQSYGQEEACLLYTSPSPRD